MPQFDPVSSELTIRPARPNDAPVLCRLLQEVDAYHQPFDRLEIRQGEPKLMDQGKIEKAITNETDIVHVAERNENVVAYVRMSIENTNGNRIFVPLKVMTVHDLVVARSDRCNGIGRALMLSVENTATKAGVDRIRLEYYADNDTARQFYSALGFRELRHTAVRDLEQRPHDTNHNA